VTSQAPVAKWCSITSSSAKITRRTDTEEGGFGDEQESPGKGGAQKGAD
jgi:hypothetical protein